MPDALWIRVAPDSTSFVDSVSILSSCCEFSRHTNTGAQDTRRYHGSVWPKATTSTSFDGSLCHNGSIVLTTVGCDGTFSRSWELSKRTTEFCDM